MVKPNNGKTIKKIGSRGSLFLCLFSAWVNKWHLYGIDLHREALHGSVSITNISSVGREIEYFKVLMLYPDTAIFTVS